MPRFNSPPCPEKEDDGSLSFLNLPPDEGTKRFSCQEITQQRLSNTSFWVIDYFENIKTKFGEGRFLIKIKYNLEDSDEMARKFFTNSQEIKYILQKVKEMDKLPRRVTMRASGNRYYFE